MNHQAERGIGALVGSGKLENIEMAYNLAVSSGDENLILYADIAFENGWCWANRIEGQAVHSWDLVARVKELRDFVGGRRHDIISRWGSVILGDNLAYNELLVALADECIARGGSLSSPVA